LKIRIFTIQLLRFIQGHAACGSLGCFLWLTFLLLGLRPATMKAQLLADTLDIRFERDSTRIDKIYYRPSEAPGVSPAPKQNRAPEFIPVVFDDEEEQDEELKPDGTREVIGDGCVYDLMGRKVATREQVEDGSWKQRVATGIYIINGKKIRR